MAGFFSNIRLSTCYERIIYLLHPLIESLHDANVAFCEKNQAQFRHVEGFKEYKDHFKSQFEQIKINYMPHNSHDLEKISDYISIVCIFFNNLPLFVFSDGCQAGEGKGRVKQMSNSSYME